MSLAPLANYLIYNRKTVKILDENINQITKEGMDDLLKGMSQPYIFGISCVTANIVSGYNVAKNLKAMYPDSKVIMGGIHPTVLPEEALNTGCVDIVVRGEGEETLNSLHERIKNKTSYSDVNGISYIDENEKIIHNPPARLFPDLNLLLPFPYHLFEKDIDKYNFGIVIVTRGCPHDCIFCSSRSVLGKKYRYPSPEKVVEQLDLLVDRYKRRYIYFVDDNLVVNKNWTIELCKLMVKREYYKRVKFSCSLRGDAVSEEVLKYLKKAGFVLLNFGIESVINRLLKILKKGETIEEMTKAVVLTRKLGITVGGTFILGLPTETKEERRANYTWALKYLDLARFNNLSPYPGTESYEIAKKEGRLNVGENWNNLNPVSALVEQSALPYVPKTCSKEELYKDIRSFNYWYWLRPKKIFLLLSVNNPTWFTLKPGWYLNPLEWIDMLILSIRVTANSIFKILVMNKWKK